MHVAADWADIFDTPNKQEKSISNPIAHRFQETCRSTRKPWQNVLSVSLNVPLLKAEIDKLGAQPWRCPQPDDSSRFGIMIWCSQHVEACLHF